VASVRESFQTGRARLRVRNPAGDVQIEARDGEETTVELVPLNDSDATRDALQKATVSASGDEVVVEIDSGRNWSISIGNWGIGSAKVGVRIVCPTGSELQCDTASADVRVEGTLGTTRVRTASGDLRLERIEGQLEAKSASGDVQVDHVEGRAGVQTVSGDVIVRTAMSGLSVNSVSGDVIAEEVLGSCDVTTVSGDAILRAAGPGEVSVKTVSGDAVVAMRRGLRVRLDVNSVSGKIGSELDVSDAPTRSDGPEANLRVRTVSGDVKISRAAEAVA
jgi:DUF4097 and DUF4098 domain-containing protein YvlB